jgi:hypothetical protein
MTCGWRAKSYRDGAAVILGLEVLTGLLLSSHAVWCDVEG